MDFWFGVACGAAGLFALEVATGIWVYYMGKRYDLGDRS